MDQPQKAREAQELRPGTVVAGKFVIEDFLAEGAMGSVYRARQEPMGREVALKVMRRHLDRKPSAVKRFFQEAVAVSKLKHPNSITLFDFGRSDDERLYLAMELIEGKSLKQLLFEQRRLGLQRTVRIVSQVALALAEAHREGIVHRDLKPANILLVDLDGQPDFVKVIDFGIAQLDEASGDRLTKKGAACGTPSYMSPEQLFEGREVDRRSDLFTLGVLMYEMLEGKRPYDGADVMATIERRRSGGPDPMSERHPKSIRDFVHRLLALDPNARPSSVDVLLRELEAALPPGVRLHLIELRLDQRSKETVRVDAPDFEGARSEAGLESAEKLSPGLQTLVQLGRIRYGSSDEVPLGTPSDGAEPVARPPGSRRSDPAAEPSPRTGRSAPLVVGVASLLLAVLALVLWDPLGTFSRTDSDTSTAGERASTAPLAAAPDESQAPPPSAAPASAEASAPRPAEGNADAPPPVSAAPPANAEVPVNAAPPANAAEPVVAVAPVVEVVEPPKPDEGAPAAEPTEAARAEGEARPSHDAPPLPGVEAAVCASHAQCLSGNCSNGRCAPPGFAYIPPGRFSMGVPGSREEPPHDVTLTRPFFLSRTETTQAEWTAVMERLNTENESCGPDCPAENSRWIQVVEYLNARSRAEGLEPCYHIERDDVSWPRGLDCNGYRLPTEAEWEYAARAGSVTDYPCGNRPANGGEGCLLDIAWTRENSGNRLHPVGQRPPNGFGLFDVIGNAWEFVWDRHGPYPAEPQVDPLGPDTGEYHIRRGCSYASTPSACGTGVRNTYGRAGLRPARSVPE